MFFRRHKGNPVSSTNGTGQSPTGCLTSVNCFSGRGSRTSCPQGSAQYYAYERWCIRLSHSTWGYALSPLGCPGYDLPSCMYHAGHLLP